MVLVRIDYKFPIFLAMKTFFLTLLILASLALLSCDKDPPEDITDFAYPPEEMLRYFDFPVGSWWAYECLTDGTVDSFLCIENNAIGELREDRLSQGAYYKGAGFTYVHISMNGSLSLDTFGYGLNPYGIIDNENESEHQRFFSRMGPANGQFNPHEEMYYPIEDPLFLDDFQDYRIVIDTQIQGRSYDEIVLLKDVWDSSTIPVYVKDKYYVLDIGIVKYTLNNGHTYELIDYHINN